jgi:hypothetical protein
MTWWLTLYIIGTPLGAFILAEAPSTRPARDCSVCLLLGAIFWPVVVALLTVGLALALLTPSANRKDLTTVR